MNLLLFSLLVGCVWSLVPPSPPSWDAVDIHVAIAGNQEVWISYKQQKSFTIQAEYYNNNTAFTSWLFSIMDLQAEQIYVWAPAPTDELMPCYRTNATVATIPPPISLVVGDNFEYNGVGSINEVSVYNWSVGVGNYDFLFEQVSNRAPYAVYSRQYQMLYYFTIFEEVIVPTTFFSIPDNISCNQE